MTGHGFLDLVFDNIRSHGSATYISTISVAVAAWYFLQRAKKPRRSIDDEVVVIIGASSGVGLEITRLYADSCKEHPDRTVHVVARRADIQEVKEGIRRSTGCERLYAHVADASSEISVAALARQLQQTSGKVDTLIFCAGALTTLGFLDLVSMASGQDVSSASNLQLQASADQTGALTKIAEASYKANVLSCMITIAKLVPLLQLSSRPRIAVLSSVAAEIPAPTRSIYAAHKAALSMFLQCLRIEFDSLPVGNGLHRSHSGIGISIIHPASINTGLRDKSLDGELKTSQAGQGPSSVQGHEKNAMTAEFVARRVKGAIDDEIDEVWLPGMYWWVAKVAMVISPSFIARKAKQKYKW